MVCKCCFAGHGEIYNTRLEELVNREAIRLIEEQSVKEFWVGNYGEFDKMASSVVRKLKNRYAYIKLVLVIPYLTKDISEYASEYKSKYDEIIVADVPVNTPKRFHIIKGNEFMVRECEFLIAYVSHSWGGAAKTLEYAKRKKKTVVNIAEAWQETP